MEATTLNTAIFCLGVFAGWFGGVVSGGISLVSVSGMMLLGIPLHTIMPVYFASSLTGRAARLREYVRAKKVVWRHVLPLSVATLAGSMTGAMVLIDTSESTASAIVQWVILLFVPLALIENRWGVQRVEVSRRRELLGYLVYFLIACWTSFFAAWAGMLMLYAYLFFFGLTILEVKGTDVIPGAFLDIGAVVIFALHGQIAWHYVLWLAPGMVIGCSFGARTALQLGDQKLYILVKISMIFIAIKTILQLKFMRPFLSFFGLVI